MQDKRQRRMAAIPDAVHNNCSQSQKSEDETAEAAGAAYRLRRLRP